MQKSELVRRASRLCGYKQQIVNEVMDAIFEELREGFLEGENFVVERLFSLKPKVIGAKVARNPLTGETINLPPTLRLRMTVAPSLRKELADRTSDYMLEHK